MTQTFRSLFTPALALATVFLFSACAKKEKQLQATIDTSKGAIVVRLYEDTTPKTVANFVGLADGTRLLKEDQDPSEAKPFYDGLIFHRVIPDFMIQGGCPDGNGSGGPGYTFEDETYAQGPVITGQINDIETAKRVLNDVLAPHYREHNGKSPNPTLAKLLENIQQPKGIRLIQDRSVEELAAAVSHEGEIYGQGKLLREVAYGTLCMANAGPNTNGSQFFIVTKKGGTPWLNGKHTVFGEVLRGMEVAETIQNVERGSQDKPNEDVIIESVRVNRETDDLVATITTSHGIIAAKLFEDTAPITVENFIGLADGTRLLEEGADPATAKPFYDGLVFHRVIPDFMIQGGCPLGNGTGGPGYAFEDETYTKGPLISGKIEDPETAQFLFDTLIVPHLRERQGRSPNPMIAKIANAMQERRGYAAMLGYVVEDLAEAASFEGEIYEQGELLNVVSYGKICMANAGPNTNGSQFFIVTNEKDAPWLDGKHTVFGEVIEGMEVAKAIQNVDRDNRDKPLDPVTINSVRVKEVKVKLPN